MEIVLSILVGALYTVGFYLVMQRRAFDIVLGLAVLGHGANLVMFSSWGVSREGLPLIEAGSDVLAAYAPNPLPQALILTAIVIGFGVTVFSMILLLRLSQEKVSDDIDQLRMSDQ